MILVHYEYFAASYFMSKQLSTGKRYILYIVFFIKFLFFINIFDKITSYLCINILLLLAKSLQRFKEKHKTSCTIGFKHLHLCLLLLISSKKKVILFAKL